MEARRTVEVGIAELAASRRNDEHLDRMAVFIDQMRKAHQQTDVDRFVESDLAFHATLFEAVDNVFLDALFEPLTSVLRTLRHQTSSVSEIRIHAIDWHTRILACVTEDDPDASREAMRGHLLQTQNDIVHFLGDQRVAQAALGLRTRTSTRLSQRAACSSEPAWPARCCCRPVGVRNRVRNHGRIRRFEEHVDVSESVGGVGRDRVVKVCGGGRRYCLRT